MRKLYPFACLFLVTACGPKVLEPLYTSQPTLKPTPAVQYLSLRDAPESNRQELQIFLNERTVPKNDNFYNNPGASRKAPDQAPSVIIAVPREAETSKNTSYEASLGTAPPQKEGDIGDIFRTDGYYNEAEQAVEGALLRKGFNVLDRSKFEAKLRDLRDRANDTRYWWTNYDRLIENKDYDALKSLLAEQLKKGELNQEEYVKRMREVDEISQIGLPGKKRTEDEMIDIAEVIRASQTGADQAEYLLQINSVAVSDAGNRTLSIKELPEVEQFIANNPGLRFGNAPHALPAFIPSHWLRTEFNAKLISVKTGSIVWLGTHELESWAAEPIQITFDVQRIVSNEEPINNAIRNYNSSLQSLNKQLEEVKQELTTAYVTASQKHKFDDDTQLQSFKSKLTNQISTLEGQYNSLAAQLIRTLENPPSEVNTPWAYSYIVSDPIIKPNLLVDGRASTAGEQNLLRHRRELIKAVTQQLIQTIVIE